MIYLRIHLLHSEPMKLQLVLCEGQSECLMLRGRHSFILPVHAHFISKMAAVQDGQIDPEGEKDIKTETSNDGAGNTNANAGGALSSSPGSASSGGTSKTSAGGEDQQTLLAVLQFLKRNKLSESVDILRREAGLSEDLNDSQGSEASGGGSGGSVNVDAEGGDANSLLSRVSIANTAPPTIIAPAPSKGSVRSITQVTSHACCLLLAHSVCKS